MLKFIKQEHEPTDTVTITHSVLSEIIDKLQDARKSTNDLKGKIKYRDLQVCRINEQLKSKISKEQYDLIENELINVPGNIGFIFNVIF